MRFEAQTIRSSLPLLASLDCSSEPLPDSDGLVRKTFGSPSGGPLATGFGVGEDEAAGASLSVPPLGFEEAPGCAAVAGPAATAGGAPAAVVSSDGRNALASSMPAGSPAWSGPLWML